MGSAAVSRQIRIVKRYGSKSRCGPWNLFWLRLAEPEWVWHITCAKGVGGAVERHKQQRRARAMLRSLKTGLELGAGLCIVVEWARPSSVHDIKEGLKNIESLIHEIHLDSGRSSNA